MNKHTDYTVSNVSKHKLMKIHGQVTKITDKSIGI